ncbi:MAG: murein biosynthesis integral membrane protein MurJ [Amnibacterium sp.]
MSAPAGLGRASAILASGTIVSRVLGFVRATLLTAVIGLTGYVPDAFNQATYVPNSIYALIGGGLFSAILVPQIVRASTGEDRGQAYVNKLVTIAILGFAVVTLVVTVGAPVLMPLFVGNRDELPIAVTFAFWSLPQLFFLGLYSVLGEVLNARRSFGPYTWAPVLNNVVAIASLGVFVALFGAVHEGATAVGPWEAAVVAGGSTLGIAAQALVLTLAWRHAGLTYRPDFRWRGVGLSATGRAAGWTLAMLLLTQVAGLVEQRVASSASGPHSASVAAMSIAWLIFMLPHSIITVSLVTVFYPRMSEHAAAEDMPALRGDVLQALRIVLLLLTLADVALVAAALPFSALFAHSSSEAAALAPVLIAYLVGLLPFTALFVLQRTFYALGDTRTPFRFTAIQVVVVVAGVLLCLLLPRPAIAAGIAAVVSFGGVVQLAVAAVLLRRRIGPLGGGRMGASLIRFAVAGAAGLAVGLGLLGVLGGFGGGWPTASRIGGLLATVLIGLVVAVGYVLVLAALRAPELGAAIRLVLDRLRPSRAE